MSPRLNPILNTSSNPNPTPNPSHDPSRKLALTLTRTRQHGERGKGCISFAPRQVGWREGDALSVPPPPTPTLTPAPAIYGFPAAARAETPHSSTNTLGRGHRRPHPPHPHDASTSRDQPPHTAGARACASPYLRSGSDMLFVNASNRCCFSGPTVRALPPQREVFGRRKGLEGGVRRSTACDGVQTAWTMASRRPTKKRPGVRAQAHLPYLPPELLTHIVHSASDPSTVLTMHLLSRRYSVECHLAIDTVLSRQPMAAYLCAYSSYHRLLLLGRAGRYPVASRVVLASHAHLGVVVVESRSRLAARCVSFYQIVCLSVFLSEARMATA